MRFWDDMRTKFGFNDGDSIPDGVETYRAVYIRAVNQLAEQLGSELRATAYDRSGLHNWCLILFYAVTDLKDCTPEALVESLDLSVDEVTEADAAMQEAIRQGYLLDLDRFVQVSVSLSDDFAAYVAALYPVDEDTPLVVEVKGRTQHIYPGDQVRLVGEVNAFDGVTLPIGDEYVVVWIDYHPLWSG